jgi:hypothetical protein
MPLKLWGQQHRARRKTIMSKVLYGLAVIMIAGLAAPHPAQAQLLNYAFCAQYDLDTISCAFDTRAQCMASVSGRNGVCYANPEYRPNTPGAGRRPRHG